MNSRCPSSFADFNRIARCPRAALEHAPSDLEGQLRRPPPHVLTPGLLAQDLVVDPHRILLMLRRPLQLQESIGIFELHRLVVGEDEEMLLIELHGLGVVLLLHGLIGLLDHPLRHLPDLESPDGVGAPAGQHEDGDQDCQTLDGLCPHSWFPSSYTASIRPGVAAIAITRRSTYLTPIQLTIHTLKHQPAGSGNRPPSIPSGRRFPLAVDLRQQARPPAPGRGLPTTSMAPVH